MIRLVSFATLIVCVFGAALPNGLVLNHFQERIVGGKPIDITDAAYQIGLLYYGNHRCGASLVTSDTVITAAHCVYGLSASNLGIRAGTDGRDDGEKRNVKSFKVHDRYNNLDFDVAILKLDQPLVLSTKIKTIEMVNSTETIEENEIAFISGWGALSEGGNSPKQLHGANVPMVDRQKCNEYYFFLFIEITNNMICAGLEKGGIDSCQGDSGGPLTIDGKLSGIVSWGHGCARPEYPGVYASVSALRGWIDQNL